MQSYGCKCLIFNVKNEGLSCLNSHMNSFKTSTWSSKALLSLHAGTRKKAGWKLEA